jgi:hypothetical protein
MGRCIVKAMFKVAFGLLIISAGLSAGVIQVSPYEFDVTASVTATAPTNGAGVDYSSAFDVLFYYSGPTTHPLNVGILYNSLTGPGCSGTGFPSCDVGFSVGATVNGIDTGADFGLDTNDFGGDVGGSLFGTGTLVDGWNTAVVGVNLFLTGYGIQNPQAPFSATVAFSSGFATVYVIPEPSTLGLAFLGFAACAGCALRGYCSAKRPIST